VIRNPRRVGCAAGGLPGSLPESRDNKPMWSLLSLIRLILQIYSWVIIAAAVMSWLVAFGVLNVRNQFIRMVVDVLYRVTEPVLRPIRRILPNLGGVDISPVIVLLIIFLLDHLIVEYGFGLGR
jgi:YggT family protein